jgi:hypothetical protein
LRWKDGWIVRRGLERKEEVVFGVGVSGFLDELLLDSVVKLCCPRQFENSGLCVQEDGNFPQSGGEMLGK